MAKQATRNTGMQTRTSRRSFIKGAGLTLAGAAAWGMTGCAPKESGAGNASDDDSWDGEYDVIVAGAGIAGLTAAVTVAKEGNGAKCLLLEKDSRPNGNSPFCAGWQMYFEESDGPLNYLDHLIGDCTPQETIRAYVEEAMHNLDWVLELGAQEEWLDIYRPEPEETNEYAEYPDSHTVGYLLFKPRASNLIISTNSCSESSKRAPTSSITKRRPPSKPLCAMQKET